MTHEEEKEKGLKDLVLEFRRKNKEYLKQMAFCTEHNFEFEAQIFKMKADLMNDVAFEIEHKFKLGFVWSDSING